MMDPEVFWLGVCLGEHLGWIAEPVLSLEKQMVSYHQDLEHLRLNFRTDNIVHSSLSPAPSFCQRYVQWHCHQTVLDDNVECTFPLGRVKVYHLVSITLTVSSGEKCGLCS